VPRHPPCALKNLRNKDARVHCAVLNIRPGPPRCTRPANTPTPHNSRDGHAVRTTPRPRPPTTSPYSPPPPQGQQLPGNRWSEDHAHPPPQQQGVRGRALRTQQRAKPTRNQSRRSTPMSPPVVLAMPHATRRPTNRCSTLSNPHGTLVRERALPASEENQVLLRKEVIQPHLPVRLPCYDLVPITSPTFDGSLPQGVGPPASGVTDFRDLTGGVYKARERIHRSVADLRLLATPTSWGRVADPNPN
jgi:hypothetical protein